MLRKFQKEDKDMSAIFSHAHHMCALTPIFVRLTTLDIVPGQDKLKCMLLAWEAFAAFVLTDQPAATFSGMTSDSSSSLRDNGCL
jgi:hypothetical protein